MSPTETLTLQALKDMEPRTIIATGVVTHKQMENVPVRWVATRGGVDDWAIYYGREEESVEEIRRVGSKCRSDDAIRALVPCDDEAFSRYRR